MRPNRKTTIAYTILAFSTISSSRLGLDVMKPSIFYRSQEPSHYSGHVYHVALIGQCDDPFLAHYS